MKTYYVDSMETTAPEARHRICFRHGLVTLQQRGKALFAVRYGREVVAGLSYSEAAAELGRSLMHQLACDGLLDNRMKHET